MALLWRPPEHKRKLSETGKSKNVSGWLSSSVSSTSIAQAVRRLPVKCVKCINNVNHRNCSYLAANWRN